MTMMKSADVELANGRSVSRFGRTAAASQIAGNSRGPGTVEGHTVSVHHILANLRARASWELPAGSFLELPRRGCRDEGPRGNANAIPVDAQGRARPARRRCVWRRCSRFREPAAWATPVTRLAERRGIIIASTRTARLHARAPLIWAVVLRRRDLASFVRVR